MPASPKHTLTPEIGHTGHYFNTTSPCTAAAVQSASYESAGFTIAWLLLTILGFAVEYVCLCGVVGRGWTKALKAFAFLVAGAAAVTEIHLQGGKFWCAVGEGSPSTFLDGSAKIIDKVAKAAIALFMVFWQLDCCKQMLIKLGTLVKLRLQRCCCCGNRSSSSSLSGTPTPAEHSYSVSVAGTPRHSEDLELATLGDRTTWMISTRQKVERFCLGDAIVRRRVGRIHATKILT